MLKRNGLQLEIWTCKGDKEMFKVIKITSNYIIYLLGMYIELVKESNSRLFHFARRSSRPRVKQGIVLCGIGERILVLFVGTIYISFNLF